VDSEILCPPCKAAISVVMARKPACSARNHASCLTWPPPSERPAEPLMGLQPLLACFSGYWHSLERTTARRAQLQLEMHVSHPPLSRPPPSARPAAPLLGLHSLPPRFCGRWRSLKCMFQSGYVDDGARWSARAHTERCSSSRCNFPVRRAALPSAALNFPVRRQARARPRRSWA
jgi:hypothetical protein